MWLGSVKFDSLIAATLKYIPLFYFNMGNGTFAFYANEAEGRVYFGFSSSFLVLRSLLWQFWELKGVQFLLLWVCVVFFVFLLLGHFLFFSVFNIHRLLLLVCVDFFVFVLLWNSFVLLGLNYIQREVPQARYSLWCSISSSLFGGSNKEAAS